MAKSDTFRSKVEADPDNLLFRFSLGQALYEEGRPGDAIPHLRRCAEGRDDWMLPRILLGKSLLETNAAPEARPILEAALRLAVEQDHRDPAEELRQLLQDMH